jgi:hypothetical protein
MPNMLVWSELESKLDNKNARKRRIAIWSAVAAVSAVVVSGVAYFGMTQTQGGQMKQQGLVSTSKVDNHSAVVIPQEKTTSKIDQSQGLDLQPEMSAKKFNGSEKVEFTNPQYTEKMFNDEVEPPVYEIFETSIAEASSTLSNVAYSDFESKSPQIFPFHFGDFLQLTLITPSSRKPLERKLSRWAFEVGYDQNQTSMVYKSNPELAQYVHKNYLQRMKESEFALSASQVHFALRYQLSKKWMLSAGLSWMQNRTQQNFHFRDSMPASVQQGFEADAYGNYPIFGYLNLGPQIHYEGISNVSMLSVPVGAIFEHSLNRKWTITAEALVQANYLSARKGNTLNYHNLMLQDIDGGVYRNLLWSGKFGVGVQRELNSKNSVGMRINTQGMFTPYYKQNSAIENRGWSVGLSGYYVWRFIK